MRTRWIPLLAACVALPGLAMSETDTLSLTLKPERDKVCPKASEEVVVKIDLRAPDIKPVKRTPLNLAVVLDRSGSMSGAKLEKAKQAACVAIDQLSENDVFSLVVYDNEVETLISARPVVKAEELKDKVNGLRTGGSTNLHGGVKQGARELREYLAKNRINRVLLLSDGLANVGPSSPRELANLGSDLKEEGISVTTIGLGDDYNEDLMVALAEASAANYYYVKDTEKLPEIFARELGEMKSVLARNIRIIIEVPDGLKPVDVIGHPEVDFNNRKAVITLPEVYSGQNRYFFLRCKADEDRTEGSQTVAHVNVEYEDQIAGDKRQSSGTAKVSFTSSREDSEKTMQVDVAKDLALVRNRLAKEEAFRLADAGNVEKAVSVLRVQKQMNSALPSAVQSERLMQENEVMDQQAEELKEAGELTRGARKEMQYQNYRDKNQRW